jgi:hypothetical protein
VIVGGLYFHLVKVSLIQKPKRFVQRDILPTEVNINEYVNDVGASEIPNKSHNVGLVPSVHCNEFTDPCEFPDIRLTQNLNQNESASVRNKGLSSHTHRHHQNRSSNTHTPRGMFHNIQNLGVSSTSSHVTDRGFPRNVGVSQSSCDIPFQPSVHSIPFNEQVRFSDQNPGF